MARACRAPPDHRVRALYDRRDWVSTAELLVIGHAVARMKAKSTDGLRSLGKRAADTDAGNAIGAVFELTIGTLFDAPAHPVTVMPDGTKGYDLTVSLPNGKKLRASCKARIPSKHEIVFRSFIDAVRRGLAARLPPGSNTDVIIKCTQVPSDDASYVQAHVDAIIVQHRIWKRRALMEFELPCGTGGLKPLDAQGKTLWPHAASYGLVGGMAFGDNEQVRFRDRLSEAVRKFKTHCDNASDDVGNVVFLKIPTSIRIDEARALTDEVLKADGAHVAGVYVYRTQVAADPGGRAFYLCHELHEFNNEGAVRPIHSYVPEGFTFVISPCVGRVQNVEPVLTLKLDDRELQLRETHLEQRGHRYFVADVRGGGNVPFDRPPNEAVTYMLRRRRSHERFDFPPWPTQLVLI